MIGGGGWGMFHGMQQGRGDEEVFGPVYNPRVVRRIAPYLRPFKGLVIVAVAFMLVYTATQVAVPWLIGTAIDRYLFKGDFTGLTWIVAFFIANAMLNWGSNYAQQLAMAKVGEGMLYALRRDLFHHCQRLSVAFYDRTEVGRIMSRVQGDTNQLEEVMSLIVTTLGDLLSLVGIVAAMLLMDLRLGLITMTVLPVLLVIMVAWQPVARKTFLRVRRAIAAVNAAFNENIQGVRVVQSMNRQDHNLAAFDRRNLAHFRATQAASGMSAALLPPVDILTAMAIGLCLFYGSRMVTGDTIEVGQLIAFVMYIQRFFDPVRNLTMQYTQLQRSMASGARIVDLLDARPDLADLPTAADLPPIRGEVEFRDVRFSYLQGEEVLRGVNLHVGQGETVAIVGPTGAGKTTLVSLLARFYDVPAGCGAILVDGHDIREVTRDSLARQMGLVLQEPFLFSATVGKNIKYNREDATDEQMVSAARAVGAHDFITRLPHGYDTPVLERGMNLSVGQRQLVSFARAVVGDPRILILDEATANIDSHTEMVIQRALDRLLEGRTAVVIAHRLSTIRGADRIVVLHRGEVVEIGGHAHLMARDGVYAHLYQMNFAAMDFAMEAPADAEA